MNQTAQGLAALGRGPDTQLVHMAPSEVQSLQSLAKAHGGSLTINPETGLPEAGFLSSILPMVIGAGLTAASGGTLTPLMAAMMTGGGYAAATGSLKKGMMAGFGAYGGAGLGGGLMSAGAASGAGAAGAGTPEILGGIGTQPATFSGNLAQAGQGLTALPTSEAARTAFMQNIGGAKGLGMAGLAATAPMLMPETATKQPTMKTDADMGQRYSYSPGVATPTPTPDVPGYGAQDQNFGREQTYFKPQYAKLSGEAARSVYGYASGGPVEAMSNANALGASTGFPQSGIRTGVYATPFQQPMGQNVVTGAQDAAVDPYTGQAQFADGGSIGGYTYDQATGKYSGGIPRAEGSAPMQYANGSIGGYSYNPTTRQYAKLESTPEYLAHQAAAKLAASYQNIANSDGGGSDGGPGPGPGPGSESGPGGGMSNQGEGGGAPGEGGWATGGITRYATGGISDLGSYSDGGRLLRGPGDGVSDNIPAMIGKKQPARLADGEFVVPARIVSELGNGSTEAGARKLYAMMDRVQKSRGKTVGKGKIATNSRAEKHLPA